MLGIGVLVYLVVWVVLQVCVCLLGSWRVYSGDSGLMLLVSFVGELVLCVVVCLLFALVRFGAAFARFADVVAFVVLVGVASGCLVGCCMLLTVVGFGFGLWCLRVFWLLWVIGLVCYSAALFGVLIVYG